MRIQEMNLFDILDNDKEKENISSDFHLQE